MTNSDRNSSGYAPAELEVARFAPPGANADEHSMLAALKEAERFLDYFANGHTMFVGPGTPLKALAMVRAAIANAVPPTPSPTGTEIALEAAKKALREIRDHWATNYDHPHANSDMYRGPYGIGIVDGHRAAANIARAALAEEPT